MLENLDTIDWKSYDAEYMPALIRGLTSRDQNVRFDAYDRLELIFYPLPTGVWEELDAIAIQKLLETNLSTLVVPFFIELLQSEAVERKRGILQWLGAISRYREYVENEADWERAMQSFETVKSGSEVYSNLLGDADAHIKALAQELLDSLQGD